MRKSSIAVAVIILLLILFGAAFLGKRFADRLTRGPDPVTVAAASLESMREQARLTAFAARFVAVVTSTQNRFGLKAQKTLIMPGTVRYELDLSKLDQRDVAWDESARRLTVTLPQLEISRPQIELAELQEYQSGGVLMAFGSVESQLDAANRAQGTRELIRQAQQPLPFRLARDAAKQAVQRTFAMPLKAAGLEAEVVVRFADEPDQEPSYLDRSRRIEDVLSERRAARGGRN